MKTQITRFVCLLVLFGFGSCSQTPDMAAQSTSTRLPIYTATQHITPTFVETPSIIASPVPSQPTYEKITPDEAQIANWKEYETALANRLLSYETSRGREVICEWELLGQDETELYVWTICSNTVPIGNNGIYPISETPAVIQLNNEGIVVDVKIPGPDSMYGVDVKELFPESVQEKIFNMQNNLEILRRLSDRLEYRRDHPNEVPLFVLDATPTFVETLSIIATPVPVQPTYVKITPDEAQIANWKEYEIALANEIMFYEVSKGNEIICEWELLGQNEKELYIWTICSTFAPLISDAGEDFYPTSSIPALIQLDDNGNVVEVKIPGDYARDIRKLFPVDVQEIIFYREVNLRGLSSRLEYRRDHPNEVPLFVLDATPNPNIFD